MKRNPIDEIRNGGTIDLSQYTHGTSCPFFQERYMLTGACRNCTYNRDDLELCIAATYSEMHRKHTAQLLNLHLRPNPLSQ